MPDDANSLSPLRRIPAVEKVLRALSSRPTLSRLPRPVVLEIVREELSALRELLRQGRDFGDFKAVTERVEERLKSTVRSRIQPVINGTGVLIHTNLGRSPLSEASVAALRGVGLGYCTLELDLDSGNRGRRGGYVEQALALLCRSAAATVVNNCASALILILRHLAKGDRREVIISRGELVEIGGGFRVPEIMETSGAVLREVGTTNKTSLRDYEQAIGPGTAILLKVHRSNFYMEGFVEEPPTEELVALGRNHGIPVVEDLGSGAMVATDTLAPIPHELTAAEILAKGVDLVCVSGDKLMGGPQAGIIAGRADLIGAIKKEPLFRALRCDKLILTALQETTDDYLRHGAGELPSLPLAAMLSANAEKDLLPRAKRLVKVLKGLNPSIGSAVSRCGGGTMPKAEIPSVTIDLRVEGLTVDELSRRLREGEPPVIGYAGGDCLRIDLRTVFPDQDEILAKCLLDALG
jgi:L-seryl-tRNA(Ser) seleniumtransferase